MLPILNDILGLKYQKEKDNESIIDDYKYIMIL